MGRRLGAAAVGAAVLLGACSGGGGGGKVALHLDQPARVGPFDVTVSQCARLFNGGPVWLYVNLVNKSKSRQHFGKNMLEVETPGGKVTAANGDFGTVYWDAADLQPGADSGRGVVEYRFQGAGVYKFRIKAGSSTGEIACAAKTESDDG